MKFTLKTVLNGKVPSLCFVTTCLVLGGLIVAALQLTWEIQTLNDKTLQEAAAPGVFPALP